MKYFKIYCYVLILFLIGCASNINDNDNYEAQFKEAISLLEKEKYISAQELLNTLSIRASHTDISDEIQFNLGEAYFLNDEYQLSIVEYNKLIRRMGFSPLVEQARWRICESYVAMSPKYYLDQLSSEKAIETIQEFLEDYPNSVHYGSANKTVQDMRGKLGKKGFETGILYIKLGAYDSAILAFEHMLKKYYDTKYVSKAHLEIIRSYSLMKNMDMADEYYSTHKHTLSEELDREANKILQNIKNN